MGLSKVIAAAGLVSGAVAQKGYPTKSFNVSAAHTYLPNTDFSNERLAQLWDQVGPVSTGPITATVEPTPEPSVYPRPGPVHPLIPAYIPEVADAQLPDDFLWGVASASIQVEGAVMAEGRGPTSWDVIPHRWVNSIMDNTTADTASNFYYLYKQDNARLKNLGIQAHSFSFAWSRFFPFGAGPVNAEGVKHYDDLFDNMKENNIVPVVTLFHWDTPLALFDSYGAWTSRNIVADYVRYAKYVIERYDDQVHTWYTFNEPQYCNWRFSGYPWGSIFPSYNGIGSGGVKARFLCGHYTMIAHAEVYRWYKNEFKGTKPMSFKNSANMIYANDTSESSQAAVGRINDFNMGWFGQCWSNDGDYPKTLKDTLGDLLPKFTARERQMLKGSCDFYAIDAYTAYYAHAPPNGIEACASNRTDPNFPDCAIQSAAAPDGFPMGPNSDVGATWLQSTPKGVRDFMSFITKSYFDINPKSIVVSEVGFAEPSEAEYTSSLSTLLWDVRRSDYIRSYMDNILAARVIDGVNVTGIFAWAIYDNYEWTSGLYSKFGLQYVNLTDFQRYPKASMFHFLDFFKQHGGRNGAGELLSGNYTGYANATAAKVKKF